MKIALVTTSFLPTIGGAEFVIHNLANQWVKQGHEVCVFNLKTSRPTQPDAEYAVRRYQILPGSARILGPHRFPFAWDATRKLNHLIVEFKPDFISAHFCFPTAIWLSKIKPLPKYLITCHGADITKLEHGYRRKYSIDALLADGLNKSHRAVAISTFSSNLMKEMGVLPEKIVTIPNGVDVARFKSKSSWPLKKTLGIPPRARVILSVGRENPAKDYRCGINAFSLVAERYPDTYYVIVGQGTRAWEELAKDLGIKTRIIFLDGLFGDELVGAYQQADVFFSCSMREMCPLVVLEGMAAGLPAVVTNVSGSQDMITTGTNGIIVEPGCVNDMADAIMALLSNTALSKKYGATNAMLSFSYDWEKVSLEYLENR